MNELSGKTAIVTGASSGIGQATAMSLARSGAVVFATARRVEKIPAATGLPGRIIPVESDAAKPEQIDHLVEQAIRIGDGRLDIVVANAGHGLAGGVLSSDRPRWEEMYQLNVIGAAHLMRRAAEVMLKQQTGDIVAIGSVVGVNISPFSSFYGSTKFAIIAIAEGLRREVCQHGVRVSVVKPGVVVSEFQDVAGYAADTFGKAIAKWGKLLEPEDVARAVTFVVSQPPGVHINDLTLRPLGQDYP